MRVKKDLSGSETIYNRMIQNLSIENDTIDPILKLIFSACADEISKLNRDVKGLKENIIDEVTSEITQGLIYEAQPAHCLISCRPNIHSQIIPKYSSFTLKREIPLNSSNDEATFVAVNDYKIYNCGFRTFNDNLPQDIRLEIEKVSEKICKGKLWMLLSFGSDDIKLHDIKDLRIYLDYHSESKTLNKLFKFYLQSSEITIFSKFRDEHCLRNKGKLVQSSTFIQNTNESIFNADIYSYLDNCIDDYESSVYNLFSSDEYERVDIRSIKPFPKFDIEDDFPAGDTDFLICIDLGKMVGLIPEDKFLISALNCLPVFNLQYKEISITNNDGFYPPINLKVTGENSSFFGISSIKEIYTDSQGIAIEHDVLEKSPSQLKIIKSGINRLGKNDAEKIIKNIVDTYQSEPIAFEKYKDIFDELINRMKFGFHNENVQSTPDFFNTNPYYLLYKTAFTSSYLTVGYLLTDGKSGNSFIPGRSNCEKTIDSKTDLPIENISPSSSVILISQSVGGRDPIIGDEKRFEFWNSFYTKGNVVTIGDIKSYCYKHFGSKIKCVEVQKKYTHDNLNHIRGNVVVEVSITLLLNEREKSNINYYRDECKLLNNILAQKATSLMYDIEVNLQTEYF
jgi:hypothetical protein